MRRGIVALLAIAVILSPILMDGTSAADDNPAFVYFFDKDGYCVAEVHLMPGTPIRAEDIPWHGNYLDWYDENEIHEDGRRVYQGVTFTSGTHIVRALSAAPTPEAHQDPIDLGMIALVIAVVDLLAIGYLIIRRR